MTLHIGPGLDLPDDYVTQTAAILARRGAGKTYTAKVTAEELIGRGLQTVVLDPLGVWWGLRAGADGNEKGGLPVKILGGAHGDLPLEHTAGTVVAEFIARENASIVLDLSSFESNAQQMRFVTDFAERLYRAKVRQPSPLHLIVDEADSFAPQRPQPGEQRMLGAFEAIVRRGRSRGLGCTLITQRAASLNKNVLTQTECLIILQVTGPQDRKAIDEWVAGNGTREERDTVMGSLASLNVGESWWWSPSWLRTLKRVQVRRAHTFDSSSTPKAGEHRIEPSRLAAVDLDALKEQMAATIEKAQRDDPKLLKARIRELERDATKRPAAEPEVRVETITIEAVPESTTGLLAASLRRYDEHLADLAEIRDMLQAELDRLVQLRAAAPVTSPPKSSVGKSHPAAAARVASPPVASGPIVLNIDVVGKAATAIITAVLQHGGELPMRRAAALAGYSPKKSTVRNALSELRIPGYIAQGNNPIRATDLARRTFTNLDPLPSGDELLEFWHREVGNGTEWRVLQALISAYPNPLDKHQLAARAGIDDPEKSTLRNAMSRLRTLGIVDGWAADHDFMEAISSS